MSRFIAAHDDDRRASGEYVSVAWLVVPLVCAALAIAATVGAAPLAHSLGGITPARMRIVLLASVVLLGCSLASNAATAYAVGRRRMVVPNIAQTVGVTINFVASVGAIALGADLVGYALANAGAGLVLVLVSLAFVLRYEERPPMSRPRIGRLVELLGYSLKAQMVGISSLVNYQTDKIVIALSVGPAAAGAYELANRAAIAVREIGIWSTYGVGMELTSDLARAGMERVRRRYARLNAITAAIGLAPILLAVATAPLLLTVWLHSVPRYSEAVLVALCVAYLPAATTGVSFGVAIAASRPGIVARTAIVSALANVVLTVALAPVFGIWGILAGTTVALVAGQLAQVVVVHRAFSLPAASYLDAVLPPLRVYVPLAVPVGLVCWDLHVRSRAAGAAILVLAAVVYLLGCGAWAARAGRLPESLVERLRRRPLMPSEGS